jgi:histidine triad (HIT) family protein
MDCLFCKIANKILPSDIVYEDDLLIAFNDIHPKAPIHQLIIPRKHIATINEITEDDVTLIGRLHLTAKQLAKQQDVDTTGYRLVMNCNKQGGQEVYHIHLHLLAKRQMTWPPG